NTKTVTGNSFTIDTLNPTVAIDIVATSLSDGTPSSSVTFAFSERPEERRVGDISPTHGSVSSLVMDDATHYHATFTADDGFETQGSVKIYPAKSPDPALNATVAATPDSVTIDTLNPTVAIDIVATSLSDGTPSSSVTFAFSE